jgi:hypothetical protein
LNGLMMAVTSFMKTLSRIGGLAPGKQTRLKSKRSAWLCNASSPAYYRGDASEPLVTKPVPLIRRRTAFVTATASVHGS